LNAEMIFILSGVPDGRVFGLDQQTLIQIGIHAICFLILALIISWLLYKPVVSYIRARNDKISGQLGKASADMEQANELKQQYDLQIKSIEAERDEILDAARKKALEAGRQLLVNAKKEADELAAKAKAELQQERERAHGEIKLNIIHISSAMTDRFLVRGQEADTEGHSRIYDETVAGEEFKWQ